jgi:hypothetical protein
MPTQQIFSYIMARTNNFQWDDDEAHFVLNESNRLNKHIVAI